MGRLAEMIDESRGRVGTVVTEHRQLSSLAAMQYKVSDALEELDVEYAPTHSLEQKLATLVLEAKKRHRERTWLRKEYARFKEAEEATEAVRLAADRSAIEREASLRAQLDVQRVAYEARLRCLRVELSATEVELHAELTRQRQQRDGQATAEAAHATAARHEARQWRGEAMKLAAQMESAKARLGEAMAASEEAHSAYRTRGGGAGGSPSTSSCTPSSRGGGGGAGPAGGSPTRRAAPRRMPPAKTLKEAVERIVDRLGGLDAMIAELDRAAEAVDSLKESMMREIRDEAASERRAFITSALESMAQLRRHLVFAMSGLREAVRSPSGVESGAFGACTGEQAAAYGETLREALWVEGTGLLELHESLHEVEADARIRRMPDDERFDPIKPPCTEPQEKPAVTPLTPPPPSARAPRSPSHGAGGGMHLRENTLIHLRLGVPQGPPLPHAVRDRHAPGSRPTSASHGPRARSPLLAASPSRGRIAASLGGRSPLTASAMASAPHERGGSPSGRDNSSYHAGAINRSCSTPLLRSA